MDFNSVVAVDLKVMKDKYILFDQAKCLHPEITLKFLASLWDKNVTLAANMTIVGSIGKLLPEPTKLVLLVKFLFSIVLYNIGYIAKRTGTTLEFEFVERR